jgi:hypothetical protein
MFLSDPFPDYPHWQMKPELKRYFLMQASYWCQQFIVLALGLEKPRKDYNELIMHHFVTLWLVGYVSKHHNVLITGLIANRWGYLINLTLIGHAIYMSMDIPDAFLAVRLRSERLFLDLTYAIDSSLSCSITWDSIGSKCAPLRFSSSHGRECFLDVRFQ